MFLQTLIVGLLQPSSKNIRIHWLEFIGSCINYMKFSSLSFIITPIIKCICHILQSQINNSNLYESFSAKDILVLLKSLRIFLDKVNINVKNK